MNERKNRILNIEDIIVRLTASTSGSQKGCPLRQMQVEGICSMAKYIFQEQPMLLQLSAPVQICGDIHGQFRDLLNIFNLFGTPANRNYLFLGDYVDRGKQSLQCILLLLSYKIKYPNSFFLLRGNHQSSQLNKLYGFYDECKRRLSIRCWKSITDIFNFLPVAAVVGQRIFCVHGGLSPLIKDLSALNSIRRPVKSGDNKLISEMLWADPKEGLEGWIQNSERGTSYYFGTTVLEFFLARNQFDLVCRSHQVVEEGYQFLFNRRLVTIFSAPNYCNQFVNLAAVLSVNSELICRLEQFEGQPVNIRKRQRSVTPLKARGRIVEEIQSKQEAEKREVKVRKATKIGITVENLQLDQEDTIKE